MGHERNRRRTRTVYGAARARSQRAGQDAPKLTDRTQRLLSSHSNHFARLRYALIALNFVTLILVGSFINEKLGGTSLRADVRFFHSVFERLGPHGKKTCDPTEGAKPPEQRSSTSGEHSSINQEQAEAAWRDANAMKDAYVRKDEDEEKALRGLQLTSLEAPRTPVVGLPISVVDVALVGGVAACIVYLWMLALSRRALGVLRELLDPTDKHLQYARDAKVVGRLVAAESLAVTPGSRPSLSTSMMILFLSPAVAVYVYAASDVYWDFARGFPETGGTLVGELLGYKQEIEKRRAALDSQPPQGAEPEEVDKRKRELETAASEIDGHILKLSTKRLAALGIAVWLFVLARIQIVRMRITEKVYANLGDLEETRRAFERMDRYDRMKPHQVDASGEIILMGAVSAAAFAIIVWVRDYVPQVTWLGFALFLFAIVASARQLYHTACLAVGEEKSSSSPQS